jgi:hypothetical protein
MRKAIKYVVEYGMGWKTFTDISKAEEFCIVNGLLCEDIYEEEVDLDEVEKWA